MRNFLIVTVALVLLLLMWEAFSYWNREFIFVLPAPSQIFLRLWTKADRFWFHTSYTLKEMGAGFALAFSVAMPLAWLMDRFIFARSLLQPLFVVIQCIPMFTLAPIMVVWFGWSFSAVVLPTALMIFFPLTINLHQGLRTVPQEYLDYFHLNQASSWQILWKLKLPWALPHLFSGFRLSAAIAGIAAVAGEYAGAQSGLGVLMIESRRDTDLETSFAALFCLTAISYSCYLAASGLETLASYRRPLKTIFSQKFKDWSKALGFALFVCISIIIIGCNKEPKAQQVRLILDWAPNPNHIPLYVGVHEGFFVQQGIDLNITKLQERSHATTFLLLGQCELALGYMPHTIRAHSLGAEVVPIGILIDKPLNAFIFREGEGIQTIEDLNDKKWGYCTGSGTSTHILDALLQDLHLSPSQKLNVNVDLVSALGRKQVDVIYGAYWNIETEHLRSQGIPTGYFKLSDLEFPDYYELIVLAKGGSLYAQEEFSLRFQRALQRSIDYAMNNPHEAFEIYCKFQPDKSQQTLNWEEKAWKLTLPILAKGQTISHEVWSRFENWLRHHHLLDAPPKP